MKRQSAVRVLSLAWAMVVAALWVLAAPGWAQQAQEGTRLTVTAIASVRSQPDVAMISAAADASGQTARESEARLRDRLQEVGAALGEQGFVVTAGHLSIFPRYDYRGDAGPEIVGYEARRQLEVTLSSVDRVAQAIQLLLDYGINEIHGITYGLQNEAPARKQAIRQALAHAREQAEEIAALNGQRVLEIVSIAVDSSVHSYLGGAALHEAGAEISPTPVTVQVSATVEYRLGSR